MKLEKATQMVRIYPSDYKILMDEARARRTIVAQIIHEALVSQRKDESEPESIS